MDYPSAIFLIIAYCVFMHVFYEIRTQTLVNKLMSRNYHEYALTEKVSDQAAAPALRSVPEDLSEAEDLQHLTVF